MEGKTVILSVLMMTLFMAQIQIEAANICCPSLSARATYEACSFAPSQFIPCLPLSGCMPAKGDGTCPPGYPNGILKKSGQSDAVSDYCKLGCGLSVCGAMNTLQNTDAKEIVNGAVKQCTKACSIICHKSSLVAVTSA
ncbi:unnamed protein product [Microthlaspi erraticum]|uniref:Acidic protein n=1 Tax=Microthlaspi erraticum TaxID=1685480 RepID=A0A6D2JN95_9BRAS|nr:unnamed protein product [Microthlaspi erraticum]